LLNTQDYPASERELRFALVQAMTMPGMPNASEYEMSVRTILATVLTQENKREEAMEIARPVCAASTTGNARTQALAKTLFALKLCG
jgi:hypothetical protein